MSQANTCEDCGMSDEHQQLLLVWAELGDGAFVAILCDVCWHRRQYKAELRARLRHGKGKRFD